MGRGARATARIRIDQAERQPGAYRRVGEERGHRAGDVMRQLVEGATGPGMYGEMRQELRREELVGPIFSRMSLSVPRLSLSCAIGTKPIRVAREGWLVPVKCAGAVEESQCRRRVCAPVHLCADLVYLCPKTVYGRCAPTRKPRFMYHSDHCRCCVIS